MHSNLLDVGGEATLIDFDSSIESVELAYRYRDPPSESSGGVTPPEAGHTLVVPARPVGPSEAG